MTAVGFEPTQLALVELESTPLDHSGKLSLLPCSEFRIYPCEFCLVALLGKSCKAENCEQGTHAVHTATIGFTTSAVSFLKRMFDGGCPAGNWQLEGGSGKIS